MFVVQADRIQNLENLFSFMSKISPMLLLVIVILSIGFFVLGLIQLLIRCLIKMPSSFPSISQSNSTRLPEASSHTFQRQLQHLFRSHDSGLNQALIDALPTFYYKEIIITTEFKEPFDCAICLCEFSDSDKLKFLHNCSHAFHIQCIETWLLSNSTCPLCRGLISTPHQDDPMAKWELCYDPNGSQGNPSMVLSVRLGKFRRLSEGLANEDIRRDDEVISSSSSRSIDARRCYSMGAFQYNIVADANVRVALSSGNDVRYTKEAFTNIDKEIDGKKIDSRSRGDSFSVSKVWLWSKKGKFPTSLDSNENNVVPMPNGNTLV